MPIIFGLKGMLDFILKSKEVVEGFVIQDIRNKV